MALEFIPHINPNAPARLEPDEGVRTEGMIFDARKTLRLPRSLRERMAALMCNLQHENAVAWPDLRDWIDYLEYRGKSERTLYSYLRELALLLREHPSTAFGEFTPEQIIATLNLKPLRSRYITFSVFNGWFNWGIKKGKMELSPMRTLDSPAYPKRKPTSTFTEEDVVKLSALPSPDGPLCTLLLCTGIRKAGARNMRRDQINLAREELTVTEKGNKTRTIPLLPEVVHAIADLDLLEGLKLTDYLWYSKPGGGHRLDRSRPVADTTFDRWWTRVCREAGVVYLNVHQTRHTFGHRLRKRGVGLDHIKLLMGHESIKTTVDQYGHVTIDDVRTALAEVWE
jgi:integrase/recombinase XerC